MSNKRGNNKSPYEKNSVMTEHTKSGVHSPTIKKVFIQRDYTEGTNVKFQMKFPPELDTIIDRQQFEHLITTLNLIYSDAERISGRTCCESCFACITAYVSLLCMETYYEKCLKKIAAFIDEQNDTVWKPRGLLVTDPIERGLRVIEITIYSHERPEHSNELGNNRNA